MTTQEYKDLATANGYKLGEKTDAELLADYAFHKAACSGMEEELFNSRKEKIRVSWWWIFSRGFWMGIASFNPAHRVRFMIALDGLDMGAPEDKIWENVCNGRPKKSEVHDKNGYLILSKI